MDKVSTSVFRARMAAYERDKRTRALEDAITRQLDGKDEFSRSKLLKAEAEHDKSIRKGRKTYRLAEGKMAKKIRGVKKSVKSAISKIHLPKLSLTAKRVAAFA